MKKTELKKGYNGFIYKSNGCFNVKKNGLDYGYLNVSGMRFNENRHRLHKNMSVTLEEKEAFEKLINEENVEVYMQTTTRDEKTKVSELLKNY